MAQQTLSKSMKSRLADAGTSKREYGRYDGVITHISFLRLLGLLELPLVPCSLRSHRRLTEAATEVARLPVTMATKKRQCASRRCEPVSNYANVLICPAKCDVGASPNYAQTMLAVLQMRYL